jgi:hypothetical protein
MKKYGSALFFTFVLIAIFCFAGYGFAQEASDEKGYGNDQEAPNGEVSAPPPLDVQGPPDLAVVPSERYPDQYVYMVPNMVGVYAYHGVWYRNYGGIWFSSPAYNGIWATIGIGIIPPIILSVPLEYSLFLPLGYHRIHYGDYYGHWREWERGRYWHHQNWYRNEMRGDVRRDRMHHIEHYRQQHPGHQQGGGHQGKHQQ